MAPLLLLTISAIVLLQWNVKQANAFQAPAGIRRCQLQQRHSVGGAASTLLSATEEDGSSAASTFTSEAEQLLAKAKAIRESLPESPSASTNNSAQGVVKTARQSEFALPPQSSLGNAYRLYIDIGREPGTWMDPRWGGSGKRIECTLELSFSRSEQDDVPVLASDDIRAGLAKTVTSKSSSLSRVNRLQFAPNARLRRGYGRMIINDGGYCIESSVSSTLRFCINADGMKDGDVSIPEGKLFFALPFFGFEKKGADDDDDDDSAPKMALSTKEGTITVKQMGWHTGWYREESRMLGVFRAVPLEKARARDGY